LSVVYFAAKVEFQFGQNGSGKQNRKGKDIKDEAVLEVCKTVFICIYHRADFMIVEVIGEVIMPLLLSNIN